MSEPQTFYNSACPVCSFEIARYRRLTAGSIDDCAWRDINASPEALASFGVSLEDVKRKLHVVDADGRLHVGVGAFAVLWHEIPRYRWVARLVRMPVVRTIAGGFYEVLADLLYAWNRRRERNRVKLAHPSVET